MFTVEDVIKQHCPTMANKPILAGSLKLVLRNLLHEKEMLEFGETYPNFLGLDFVEQVLTYFNVSYSVRDIEKERIPSFGRLVIIANHPIGSLDVLALIKLLSEVRDDVKVVANEMLMTLAPLQDILLPVNNMQGGTPKQHLTNIYQHLKNEGVVLIFPAGEVSRLCPKGVRDTKWLPGFLTIAKHSKSPILPVFVEARNSPLFYGISMLYKPLASTLLVKEMFKQKRKHLPIRIGEIIPVESYFNSKLTKQHQVKSFKKHLYLVGHGKEGLYQTQSAIALPEDRQTLSKCIKSRCERIGETADGKLIYLYQHTGSSAVMREIGRLREVAFRAVGEGTNKRRDIDKYDNDYYHLVLWDQEDLEIAGAYRFGDAKKIVEQKGLGGLYSNSLFDYSNDMLQYLEQGLELGRSFVQPKYWGKRSLDYLWYGLGAFIQKHQQFRYLFGPLSLSNSYPKPAKELIVQFYLVHFGKSQPVAAARVPYTLATGSVSAFNGDDYKKEFSELKHLLANMGCSVPTLFKQYAETYEEGGVKFVDFNIDADFNNCIDAFVIGDISKMKAKKRRRYLGE